MGAGLEGSGGGTVSSGVISACVIDWAGVRGLKVDGICIEKVERKYNRYVLLLGSGRIASSPNPQMWGPTCSV